MGGLHEMTNLATYAGWYNDQAVRSNEPIDFTLEALEKMLQDKEVDQDHKAAAHAYLRHLKRKTWASDAFAACCAIGAALSSMAYFLAIRDHSFEWSEHMVLPSLVGAFVAAATWYTYRHDTADMFLDFWPQDYSFDRKKALTLSLTVFTVAMEIAMCGYGVYECMDEGAARTALVTLVCGFALLPETAQTYKYLDKWLNDPNEKFDINEFKDKRFAGYMLCSAVMLVFCGMAVFPLLADETHDTVAGFAVLAYAMLNMPYMWKKAKEQIKKQDRKVESSESGCLPPCPLTAARIGSGLGDLAFSAYGYFEMMKALNVIEAPADITAALTADSADCWKSWLILLSGVAVVVASCVGSFLTTVNGDQTSHRENISEAQKNGQQNGDASQSTVRFSIYHGKNDLPKPTDLVTRCA